MIKTGNISRPWMVLTGADDSGLPVYPYMRRAALRHGRLSRPDRVLIAGPPWITFGLGPLLKRQYNIPYLLDYAATPPPPGPADGNRFSRKHGLRRLAAHVEQSALRGATGVLAASASVRPDRPPERPDLPIHYFPGGIEPSDFDYVRQHAKPPRFWPPDDKFNIVCTGAVTSARLPAIRTCLHAVALLKKVNHPVLEHLRIVFTGTGGDQAKAAPVLDAAIRKRGVGEWVKEFPERITYFQNLRVLCRADALFCPGAMPPAADSVTAALNGLYTGLPLVVLCQAASDWLPLLQKAGISDLMIFDERESLAAVAPRLADLLVRLVRGEISGACHTQDLIKGSTTVANVQAVAQFINSLG